MKPKQNRTEVLSEIVAYIIDSSAKLTDQTEVTCDASIYTKARRSGFSDADIKSAIDMARS